MVAGSERGQRTLAVAEALDRLLRENDLESALIGALACAVHGYPRATRDVDLAVYADASLQLPALVRTLQTQGYEVDYQRADAEDALGGVITVRAANCDPIQIINFCNPFSARDNPGWSAVKSARPIIAGRALRVVDLPHLIALKLYAGGAKSRLDVIELLERNASVAVGSLREVCGRFGLGADLERVLAELGMG